MGKHYELKNRYLHVDYTNSPSQSADSGAPKCKNCTLEEMAVLHAIAENPRITQKSLAAVIGKSERLPFRKRAIFAVQMENVMAIGKFL